MTHAASVLHKKKKLCLLTRSISEYLLLSDKICTVSGEHSVSAFICKLPRHPLVPFKFICHL